MTYPLSSARKWCNESEFALVSASFGDPAIKWTPALLRTKIERTRKLRDKNRDQHRTIKRTNRATTGAKVGKQVTAMAVAEKRTKLFDETLKRFTAKLEKLNAAKRPKPLRVLVAKALKKKQAAAAGGGGAAPISAPGVKRKRAAKRVSNAVAVQRVHRHSKVRARNARNQAKRDSRG